MAVVTAIIIFMVGVSFVFQGNNQITKILDNRKITVLYNLNGRRKKAGKMISNVNNFDYDNFNYGGDHEVFRIFV